MIIDVTYACNMGCSHCMSDCTPDGLQCPYRPFEIPLKCLTYIKVKRQSFRTLDNALARNAKLHGIT